VARSVAHTWRDEFGSVLAHVVVEARNTGPRAVTLRGADASYALRDPDGDLLHRGSFVYALPSVVEPSATAWFVDTIRLDFASSTELGPVEAEVVSDLSGTADAETSRQRLSVSALELGRSGSGIEVAGRVVNHSDRPVRTAVVAVVLFDTQDEPQAVLYDATDVADLAPGDDAEFATAHPETPPISLETIGGAYSVAFVPPAP